MTKKGTIDPRRAILARRARFIAAAASGIATFAGAEHARAADASAEDGSAPIVVEAGVREGFSDAGDGGVERPPQPCLSIARPDDHDYDHDHDGCIVTPGPTPGGGAVGPAIALAAAAVAARRRQKKT